mgnify:CR=1 FL=1
MRACATPIDVRPLSLPKSDPLTHYCITRADLPRGVQAAQLIHAAGESSPGDLPPGTFAIALTVPDEPALRALARRLGMAEILHRGIYEVDEPWNGQMMAIGIAPARRSVLKKLLSELPLLK